MIRNDFTLFLRRTEDVVFFEGMECPHQDVASGNDVCVA